MSRVFFVMMFFWAGLMACRPDSSASSATEGFGTWASAGKPELMTQGMTTETTTSGEGDSGSEPEPVPTGFETSATTAVSTTDSATTDSATTGTSTNSGTSMDLPSETEGIEDECVLKLQHAPCDLDSDDPLHAMGLNCTSLGNGYQDGFNAVSLENLVFQAPAEEYEQAPWRVVQSYGVYEDPQLQRPYWSPREGYKMLMISTGLLPRPNLKGELVLEEGDVFHDTAFGGMWDDDSLPPPMSHKKGSPDPMGFKDCDGVNDCSNTLEPQWMLGMGDINDKMWFSFDVKVPSIAEGALADAKGYTFDFAFFSAEFPEWVNQKYNDVFVAWQVSEDYTGNVTFVNGRPLTVTALWPIDFEGACGNDPNCIGADPHLEGTGFLHDGGATTWYRATSGVQPGEMLTLAFAIFDMGDSSYDTTVILDNWQWDCEGCMPNEINSCGVEPQ